MDCPQCKEKMKLRRFDIGRGVEVPSYHCSSCGFNVTEQGRLDDALAKFRERSSKAVKVVAIGDGLGIRFPKDIVDEFSIKKGTKLKIKPGKKGIEVLL